MDEYSLNPAGDELDPDAPETPEDVAVLYTWANVHGGKYRDFSASRREFRAQQRHRMVEQQRQAELEAARAREEAAAREMEQVRLLEEQARHDDALRAEAEEARRRAEEHIEQERQAAQQHVEAAEALRRALEEAQQEMEEARRRAEEQAARYAEADARYRASARNAAVPGEMQDPYYYAGPLEPTAFAPGRGVRSSVPQRVSSEKRIAETYYRSKGVAEPQARVDENSQSRPRVEDQSRSVSAAREVARDLRDTPPPGRDRTRPFAASRTETPMDTRERTRPDQVERLHGTVEDSYGSREDDGYYDHAPVPRPRSSYATEPNSAPENAYLPPRLPSAYPLGRTRDELQSSSASSRSEDRRHRESGTADDPRLTSAQDPAPGSPHAFEKGGAPRRDSSTAEVQARTSRSPASDAHEAAHADGERVARQGLLSRTGDAPRYGREAAGGSSDRHQEPYTRPEWLVREAASPGRDDTAGRQPQQGAGERAREMQRQAVAPGEGRRSRGSETRMIPAADGGFNLPPLRDRTSFQEGNNPDAPERRSGYREERTALEPDASAEMESSRPEPPPVVLTADPGVPPPSRPSAERRRSDRSTRSHLDRDLRAPSIDVPGVAPDVRPRIAPRQEIQPEIRAAFANARPADTLQQSRERVAARWFALKGLMGQSGDISGTDPGAARSPREIPLPVLAVVSLSGGVGKTSMVATIGRVLSSMGEVVLLADATPHGLLPYYFGARELRPDVVRTFSPPAGSSDAAVFMVNYEADRLSNDEEGQAALIREMGQHVKGAQRMLMDLNGNSAWLARRLAGMNSTILVPVAADMNSVLSIRSVERFFAGLKDADGMPQQPFYVLNQFDASLPLHLDVREVLRQQLGERLLPVMIRRSPSVAEALAEGMTVMDYAPGSPVTEDFFQLAEWVRKRSAPAQTSLRSTRWSER